MRRFASLVLPESCNSTIHPSTPILYRKLHPSILFLLTIFLAACAPQHYVRTEKVAEFEPQKIKRIAIFPFSDDQINLGVAISEALTTEFLTLGFDVVERTQLNAAIRELKLDLAGAIGDKERREIGKFLKVDAIIFGAITGYLGGWIYSLDMRLVDVSSGDILWSTNYLNKDPQMLGEPNASIGHIMDSLQKSLFGTKAAGQGRLFLAQNQHGHRKKYKKIALLPLMGTNYIGEGKALDGALTTEFLGNQVKLVERESLDKILNEQFRYTAGFYVVGFDKPKVSEKQGETVAAETRDRINKSTTSAAFSIALSDKDMESIGNLTGADGIVIGSFSPAFPYGVPFIINVANLRLLDVATSRVEWSATYYNDRSDTDDLVQTASWLAIALCPALKTENAEDQALELRRAAKHRSISRFTIWDVFPMVSPEEGYRK